MKKMVFIAAIALMLNLGMAAAISQQEISEAKNLIGSKMNCESLSNSQLEIIGEYYMEQMHPGEAHELMHKMMGLEEGSKAEEQFHINLAKTMYCDERGTFGMMGSAIGQPMMLGTAMPEIMQSMMGNIFGHPFYPDYTFTWAIIGLLAVSIALNFYLVFKLAGGKK